MSPAELPRIVGIGGSLRKDSYCSAVLRALARDCEGIAAIAIQSLRDIPLYDGDIECVGLPKSVIDLKAAIADADGVIIVSSEFLHGIPGVLKNALDWMACPNTSRALSRKPVYVITSSPALTGGVRAQMQINETIAASGGRLLARPQSVVPRAHEKMRDGEFVHAETLAFLLEGVRDLVAEIRAARGDDSLVPARPYADPTDIRRTS